MVEQKPEALETVTAIMDIQKLEKLERYKILNQSVKKGHTVFVGSSLMEQFPINELQQTFDTELIIYNRGIGGFVTQDLLMSMDTCIIELEPSKIFINIGTNDIGSPGYKLEHLLTNYDKILTRIKESLPHCRVYVMAYYPVNAKANFKAVEPSQKEELFKTRNNFTLQKANVAIKELAAKHHYEFINVNKGLVDKEGNLLETYTVEGIHMWPNAYSIILSNLKKYL